MAQTDYKTFPASRQGAELTDLNKPYRQTLLLSITQNNHTPENPLIFNS